MQQGKGKSESRKEIEHENRKTRQLRSAVARSGRCLEKALLVASRRLDLPSFDHKLLNQLWHRYHHIALEQTLVLRNILREELESAKPNPLVIQRLQAWCVAADQIEAMFFEASSTDHAPRARTTGRPGGKRQVSQRDSGRACEVTKDCSNCQYYGVGALDFPCERCKKYSHWKQADGNRS